MTLLYHAGALGDFVTVLPSIAWWREQHPLDRIVLLGRAFAGELALSCGLIHEFRDVESAAAASLFACEPSARVKRWISRFDHAVVFASADSPLVVNLDKLGVTAMHRQDPFPAGRTPAVEYHLSIFGAHARRAASEISRRQFIRPIAPPACEGCIALHPGSGSRLKNWPAGCFTELASALRAERRKVLWIIGPCEGTIAVPPSDEVIRDAPLSKLAATLAASALFVGNDSGVAHLAAAVGAPTIVLFGPSDPLVWKPAGPRIHVITAGFTCGPCHRQTGPPVDCAGECMRRITVQRVLDTCRAVLANRPTPAAR